MDSRNQTRSSARRACSAVATLLLTASFSLALPAGAHAQQATVSVTVDGPKQEGESFTFTVSVSGSHSGLRVTFDIETGSAEAADISVPPIFLEEVGGSGSLYLSGPGPGSNSIGVAPGQPAPTAPVELVPLSGGGAGRTVVGFVIPAGTSERTFVVDAVDDSASEGEETFTVTLKTGSGYTFTPQGFVATATILPSDRPGISISGASAPEGEDVQFRVALSQASTEAVTVQFDTSSGSGDYPAGSGDFTAASGQTVTIAAGQTSVMVPVSTAEDDILEADETFTATLSNPSGGLSLTRATAVGTIVNDDVATLTFRGPSSSVAEGGEAVFTLTTGGASIPFFSIGVGWRVVEGAGELDLSRFPDQNAREVGFAAAGGDSDSLIEPGATATITIPVRDDDLAEDGETVRLRLTSARALPLDPALHRDAAAIAAANEILRAGLERTVSDLSATARIAESDPATVSIQDASGLESSGGITFTVTMSGGDLPAPVPVRWNRFSGGSFSAEQADFASLPPGTAASVTFPAGSGGRTQTITVPVLDDNLAEGAETFRVSLIESSPGVRLDPNARTATGTIAESDQATVRIARTPSSSVAEGGEAEFAVSWTGGDLPAGVSVQYDIDISGAVEAADFEGASTGGSVPLLEGGARQTTFAVGTADDSIVEEDEDFTVRLGAITAPEGGVSLTTTTAARGTIQDNDMATVSISDARGPEGGNVEFTVELSADVATPVAVDYAISPGSAESPADFTGSLSGTVTIAAGSRTGTITVAAVDDSAAEGPETFTVTLSAPSAGLPGRVTLGTATATGTVVDNDAPTVSIADAPSGVIEGGALAFTVTLSTNGALSEDLTVEWSVVTGGTVTPADFTGATSGMVMFLMGDGNAATRTITVMTDDDDVVEGAETFTVTLSNLRGEPLAGLGTTEATGTIEADSSDTATVSVADASGSEGGDVEFTVTLSPRAEVDVTVDYATSVESGDTAEPADFTDTSGTLTIQAGMTTGTFTVPTVDDSERDDDPETFTVTLSAPSPTSVMLDSTATTAQGTILPSDQPVTVSIAPPASSVAEGGTATFTVTVESTEPLPAITVRYAASVESGDTASASDFVATDGELTFAAGAVAPQTMTIGVRVVDDNLAEGDETFSVTLSPPTGGFLGDVSLGIATAQATIEDDDAATVSIADARAVEGQPVRFTVRLSASPTAAVVVNYATSSGTGANAAVGHDPTMGDPPEEADFIEKMGTLTFAAGATGADLTMPIVVETLEDTMDDEGAETFTVTLTAVGDFPVGVMRLPPEGTTATGTIEDPSILAVRRLGRVNEEVLPRVAEAVASSALSAIAGRIASMASGSPPPVSGLAGRLGLPAPGSGPEGGPLSLERLLGGSSFVLPLNAAEGWGGAGALAVWGSGDYRGVSGPSGRTLEWDGHILSLHVGADARVQPGLLAGLSVSRSLGSFDYTDKELPVAVEGDYESRMTSVHPYVSWTPSRDLALWGAAGYGLGEIEIKEEGGPSRSSDTEMTMAAAGGSHRLLSDEGMFAGGTATLSLKGEGSAASVKVEGDGGEIEPLTASTQRLRLSLEGAYECRSGSGGCLAPSLEVGVRHDGGDGITGTGVEVGGGLRFTDPGIGLTVEGRGRVLLSDGDDQEDWGVGGLIRLDPGASGLGLSFDLAPAFGDAESGADRLYARGVGSAASAAAVPAGRLDAELGYGIAALHGVVTPYTHLSLADSGSRSYRVGGRLNVEPSLSLSLEGERRESGAEAPDHGVMLRGRMHW